MKTLFLEYIYLSGHGGGVYASRTHINLFSEISDEMTLVYPSARGKEIDGVNLEYIDRLIPVEDNRSNPKKFYDLLCGKLHRTQNLADEFLNREKYDVVVFDNSVVSSGLIKRFKDAGIRTVTIHHNYQIEYLKGDGSRLTLLPMLFWTAIYEKAAVENSDLNITLTKQDIELLKQHYCKTSRYDVLGVYEYSRSIMEFAGKEKRGHNYIITGGLGSKQTEDSLMSWIDKYWPLLQKCDNQAKLLIAGSNPSDRLSKKILSAGINLIPSPKDMLPILKEADYYICPTDCGGGLKLRILDGLKVGLPVLTHVISARGYEKMQNEGVVFSYSSETEFVNGIQNLINVNYSHSEIQEIYCNNYNFESGVERLKNILIKSNILV